MKSIERHDFLVEVGTEELPPKSLRTLELAFAAGRSNEWRLVRLNQSSFARDLGCTVQIVQFWMAFHEFVVEAGARELQTRRLASAARNLKRLSAALPRHERL